MVSGCRFGTRSSKGTYSGTNSLALEAGIVSVGLAYGRLGAGQVPFLVHRYEEAVCDTSRCQVLAGHHVHPITVATHRTKRDFQKVLGLAQSRHY